MRSEAEIDEIVKDLVVAEMWARAYPEDKISIYQMTNRMLECIEWMRGGARGTEPFLAMIAKAHQLRLLAELEIEAIEAINKALSN